MSLFRVCSLASGSSGNAFYAENEQGAILIDAGLSGKRTREAIELCGGKIDKLRGIVVTHDHADHIKGVGVLARRYNLQVFMTSGTYQACMKRASIGTIKHLAMIEGQKQFEFCHFVITPLKTPHDAHEPVGIILEKNDLRCGILTDLGHCFTQLKEIMASLDVVFLESNYDPLMLQNGPYPYYLKNRISSKHGHISNQEATDLVRNHASNRLKAVVLSHLSQVNNCPEVALACINDSLREDNKEGRNLDILAAPRHLPSKMIVMVRQ